MAAVHAYVEVDYRQQREPELVKCEDAMRLKSALKSREENPEVTGIRVYGHLRTVTFTRSRAEEYHVPDQTPPPPADEPQEVQQS